MVEKEWRWNVGSEKLGMLWNTCIKPTAPTTQMIEGSKEKMNMNTGRVIKGWNS